MSNGLLKVKCTNCQKETEIIPGTIVAECDHCGRLFRPFSGEGAGSSSPSPSPFSSGTSSSSSSSAAPPWETGASSAKPSWEPEPTANVPTPAQLPSRSDGRGLCARGAQEADAADAVLRDQLEQDRRDRAEARRQASRPAQDQEESAAPAPRPSVRPAPAAQPSATSAAPAVFIFITLLVLAIGAYLMARKEEASSRDNKAEPRRQSQEQRPGRRAPAGEEDEKPADVTSDTSEPAPPPPMNLTPQQRVGLTQVEKHSVVLSAEQLESVRKTITHRESLPFHFWGSKEPKLEVVVFAPFTHMGVARLRQLNVEFKKLEPFESRIAVWFVFHWGSDQALEAEAASLANAIHWTYKSEGMYHFVNLLQKEATWRVASLGKLDEYIRTVGLDPVKVRASLETAPFQDVRQEVTGLLTQLNLPDKDLTFLIGGRSYLEGKTLYNVARIVDYELAAREP